MKKKHSIITLVAVVWAALFALGPQYDRAQAAFNTDSFIADLNQLILDGNTLLASMEGVTLSSLTMATQLAGLETTSQLYLESVGDVYKNVANSVDNSTISITNEMLVPLQTLSTITASLMQQLFALTGQMVALSAVTSTTTLDTSLASMLRLSDDIGVMADRILEMSDQILIMADNIGIMADRILATQLIQSDNLQVVVDASLETQKNMLLLFSMFF